MISSDINLYSTKMVFFIRETRCLLRGTICELSHENEFKVCKSVHYRTIQINHQPDATIFQLIILTFIYGSICFGRPARPRTQHDCRHDTKLKPEAATAVIELLMMGGKTPETCWRVNKRQDNELKNCCIWLVIYLNSKWIVMFLEFGKQLCWFPSHSLP
jgi:hypothetical protein